MTKLEKLINQYKEEVKNTEVELKYIHEKTAMSYFQGRTHLLKRVITELEQLWWLIERLNIK
ncbi:MAG: hypothetical protein GY679_01975 [Mycoplasma sp.]|nr:hypothetical protein [Mycoplasma sp.]